MIITPRALIVGIWAASATPARLDGDLQRLLAGFQTRQQTVTADGTADAAVGFARITLRVLARLPGNRWRYTCLYRATAECLALRRLGLPAQLCLGAEEDRGSLDRVAAHAWVEIDGVGPTYREEPRNAMARFAPPADVAAEDIA